MEPGPLALVHQWHRVVWAVHGSLCTVHDDEDGNKDDDVGEDEREDEGEDDCVWFVVACLDACLNGPRPLSTVEVMGFSVCLPLCL